MTSELTQDERRESATEILNVVLELCSTDEAAMELAQAVCDAVPSEEKFTEVTKQLLGYLKQLGDLGKLVKGRCVSLHPAREPHLWPAVLEPLG